VSCPAKSDVSDFARSIIAKVGQARPRMKAGHPVTPAAVTPGIRISIEILKDRSTVKSDL
jgi:hypothetical protein